MPQKPRDFYIAGAGIAGLALALALAKLGARVTVLERNAALQEFGAGLQISPNARRALNALGLDQKVRARSFEPEGIDIYPFASARPLTTLTLGAAARARYGLPYAVMHRADLAQVLYDACKRFASIDIRFHVSRFDIDDSSKELTVTYRSADARQTAHPFAFIGADGVASKTRTAALAGPEAAYTGYVAWRTLVDINALTPNLARTRTSLLWGPGFHAVAYPLPHRGQINLALFLRENMSVAFGIRGTPSLPATARSATHFAEIMEAPAKWTHWPLARVTTPDWYRGRIGLVGDAAHAMLPFQAQGAAMAIEDAVTLAPLLMREDTPEAAFRRFAANRKPRVARVAALSAANGRIFHLRRPAALARDLAVRLQGPEGHFRRLDWLYAHDPVSR